MKIILLRHGQPVLPAMNKLSADSFHQWVIAYNASGLSNTSLPTEAAIMHASDCNAIVCSTLQRSVESAQKLAEKKIVLSHEIFNEAGLPVARWKKFKTSPKIWAVFFRILWLLGYSHRSESYKEVKLRASQAADQLTELAYKQHKILFVGHGVYNRLLAKELKRKGWHGPGNPGSKHWSSAVYTKSETARTHPETLTGR
ncbi:hypothetical protein MNBD_GAMMA09-1143 [hydrothermal vent metagenome]|uniref:Histidine phosphatase family protein n=1 Tax=hydrothermal vent metagenome TaxID=652676 RepID=A0A3B0X6G2_9ZZZZ